MYSLASLMTIKPSAKSLTFKIYDVKFDLYLSSSCLLQLPKWYSNSCSCYSISWLKLSQCNMYNQEVMLSTPSDGKGGKHLPSHFRCDGWWCMGTKCGKGMYMLCHLSLKALQDFDGFCWHYPLLNKMRWDTTCPERHRHFRIEKRPSWLFECDLESWVEMIGPVSSDNQGMSPHL